MLPKNFEVTYEFSNGTVAPPYHYQWTIRILPGKRDAQYEFRPGYGGLESGIQVWKSSFPLPTSKRAALYAKLTKVGFDRNWDDRSLPRVGGPTHALTIMGKNGPVKIPTFPASGADDRRAEALRAAVEEVVPARIRAEFKRRFEAQKNDKRPGIR